MMIVRSKMIPALCGMLLLAAGATAALRAANAPTARAYVIGEVQISDQEGYRAYAAATTPILQKFGGRYLARAGQTVSLEGAPPAGRVVVIEFPSLAAAKAFHESAEYKAIADIRHRTSSGRAFIVEGTPPPTP